MRTTTRRVLLAAALFWLTPASAHAQVTVDLPVGGCRLTIFEHGDGALSFGAAPRWVAVAPGTFVLADVAAALETRSLPPSATPTPQGSGSVSLSRSSELLRRIDDTGFVRGLLAQAWNARIPPASAAEQEDHRWVGDACGFSRTGA